MNLPERGPQEVAVACGLVGGDDARGDGAVGGDVAEDPSAEAFHRGDALVGEGVRARRGGVELAEEGCEREPVAGHVEEPASGLDGLDAFEGGVTEERESPRDEQPRLAELLEVRARRVEVLAGDLLGHDLVDGHEVGLRSVDGHGNELPLHRRIATEFREVRRDLDPTPADVRHRHRGITRHRIRGRWRMRLEVRDDACVLLLKGLLDLHVACALRGRADLRLRRRRLRRSRALRALAVRHGPSPGARPVGPPPSPRPLCVCAAPGACLRRRRGPASRRTGPRRNGPCGERRKGGRGCPNVRQRPVGCPRGCNRD